MERRDKKLQIKRAVVPQRQPRGARLRDGRCKVSGRGAGLSPPCSDFWVRGTERAAKRGRGTAPSGSLRRRSSRSPREAGSGDGDAVERGGRAPPVPHAPPGRAPGCRCCRRRRRRAPRAGGAAGVGAAAAARPGRRCAARWRGAAPGACSGAAWGRAGECRAARRPPRSGSPARCAPPRPPPGSSGAATPAGRCWPGGWARPSAPGGCRWAWWHRWWAAPPRAAAVGRGAAPRRYRPRPRRGGTARAAAPGCCRCPARWWRWAPRAAAGGSGWRAGTSCCPRRPPAAPPLSAAP